MKYCSHCGQQLQDGSRFCGKCGNPCELPEPIETPSPDRNAEPGNIIEPLESGPQVQPSIPPQEQAAAGIDYPTASLPGTSRPIWPLALAGVLVLLLGGFYLLYVLGNFGPPQSTKLAPANSDMYVCVKPNLMQLKNFNNLKDTFLSVPGAREALNKILEEMDKETDIDFERDIKPWLGKEAAFFMSGSNDPEKVVVALQCSDAAAAQQFLDKLLKVNEDSITRENYQGITISSNNNDMKAAIADKYLLFSDDIDSLKETIDRARKINKDNLTQNQEYKDIVQKLPWNHAAICYINSQQLVEYSLHNIIGGPAQIMRDQLDAYRSLGLSLSLQSNGIRSDYVIACENGNVPNYLKGQSEDKTQFRENLKILPADSLGFVHCSNLVDFLRSGMDSLESNSEFREGLDELESETGIDLRNDVLNELRGDVAMALTRRQGDFLGESNVPVGIVLTAGVKNQQTAYENTRRILSQLNEEIAYDEENISGHNVFFLGENYGAPVMGMGLKNDLLVMASSPALTRSVMGNNGLGLDSNKEYQQAIKPLPSGWTPQLYLNIPATAELVEEAMPDYERQQYREQILPWLQPLKSISQASSDFDSKNGIMQGACFIRIEK